MILPALSPPGSATGIGSYGPWYTVKLGGDVLPGKWRVPAGGIQLKEDPKKKPGVDGANPVFHGLDPQHFDLEGEQYTDDERNALATILSVILPQPGASQNQYPVQLQHPSIAHFGFPIFVHVLGSGVLEHAGPCTTRIKLRLRHFMQPKPTAQAATVAPTRAIRNNRKAKQDQQTPPNPAPTAQPGVASPPNFTPGT